MIENSQVTVESDGEWLQVRYIEDGRLREGPATFPARYASFAAILQYIDTNFNFKTADLTKRVEIQNLLGAPWPRGKVHIHWKDSPERDKPCANLQSQIAALQSQLAEERAKETAKECVEQILSFAEKASGKKLTFGTIINTKTGETEEVEDRMRSWLAEKIASTIGAAFEIGRHDVNLLLAELSAHQESTGESLESEDAEVVRAVKERWAKYPSASQAFDAMREQIEENIHQQYRDQAIAIQAELAMCEADNAVMNAALTGLKQREQKLRGALRRNVMPPDCNMPCDHAGDGCPLCEGREVLAALAESQKETTK